MRARGVRPWSFTRLLGRDRAARPSASEIWLDTAAVSRPPSTSVRQRADLLAVRLARAFVAVDAVERHDLALEAALGAGPDAPARGDSTANASMSSREMSHFSAIISAPRNCETSCVAVALRPSPRDPVNGSVEAERLGERSSPS